MNIEQFKSQVNNLHQQIRGLRSLENDLKMLATKKIALEEENEKLRTHINERFLLKEEENLDQNEMELENRGLLEKLALLQDQLESERLNSRTQAENQSKENENLLSKIRKLEEDLKKLKQEKQNLGSSKTEIEKRFREKIATLEEQVAQTKEKLESDQEELKTLRSERRAKDEEINRLEEELKNLQEEFDDRIVEIEVYQTKISDLEKINESLTLELKDAEVKGSSVVDPHTVADQKKKVKNDYDIN
jgi:chromosome segregation ATPase